MSSTLNNGFQMTVSARNEITTEPSSKHLKFCGDPSSLKSASPISRSSDLSYSGFYRLKEKLLHRGKSGPRVTGSTPRSHRKTGNALKFHNFVANQDKNNARKKPQAHFLKEEHGTKQITVSHWKTNNSPDEENSNSNDSIKSIPKSKLDSNLNQAQPNLVQPTQQSILESLLAKETRNVSSNKQIKTNKRKPAYVRRVLRPSDNETEVPELQEEPLDLSIKKQKVNPTQEKKRFNFKTTSFSKQNILGQRLSSESPPGSIQNLINSVEQSAAQAASIIASVSGTMPTPNIFMNTPSPVFVQRIVQPIHYQPHLQYSSSNSFHISEPHATTSYQNLQDLQEFDFNCDHDHDPSLCNHPEMCSKHQLLLKPRNTQRSLIKQKLEDAFKSNGFLVKTKQVSDGDATFCKFRQLRKYTRYYLKSWHQHLPEEVNKLWKGFLPPKTKTNSSQP